MPAQPPLTWRTARAPLRPRSGEEGQERGGWGRREPPDTARTTNIHSSGVHALRRRACPDPRGDRIPLSHAHRRGHPATPRRPLRKLYPPYAAQTCSTASKPLQRCAAEKVLHRRPSDHSAGTAQCNVCRGCLGRGCKVQPEGDGVLAAERAGGLTSPRSASRAEERPPRGLAPDDLAHFG